jgi:hypothetical protein
VTACGREAEAGCAHWRVSGFGRLVVGGLWGFSAVAKTLAMWFRAADG